MITNKETAKHYTWGQNCSSWVLADTAGLSVKQESMPSNTKEQLHFHKNAQQFFYILKGVATFYSDGDKDTIGANTGILIPAGTKHYIANETQHELEFLVISQPSTNEDRFNL
ncbi:MAG TPA: cupin domain-containing protein [Bacteroidia bacterium]|nr:cupin domain-containing protein [Bacteroidia bacterium]